MAPPAAPAGSCTVEDLRRQGDDRLLELIEGTIFEHSSRSFEHGVAHFGVGSAVGRFRDGEPGSGGWWITLSVDVLYGPHDVFRHDACGWLRDRMPERPREWPVAARPDWVCEVVDESTASNDRVRKLRRLHRARVTHYWLLEPAHGTLTVFRWAEPGYLIALAAIDNETVRAEPFDTAEISVAALLGR